MEPLATCSSSSSSSGGGDHGVTSQSLWSLL